MCVYVHTSETAPAGPTGDPAGFLGVAAIASDRFAGGLDLQIATWGETMSSGTEWR